MTSLVLLTACTPKQEAQPQANPNSESFFNPAYIVTECTPGLNIQDAIDRMKRQGIAGGKYYQYVDGIQNGIPLVFACKEKDLMLIHYTKQSGLELCKCIGERL